MHRTTNRVRKIALDVYRLAPAFPDGRLAGAPAMREPAETASEGESQMVDGHPHVTSPLVSAKIKRAC
jgi:hypothetical protein